MMIFMVLVLRLTKRSHQETFKYMTKPLKNEQSNEKTSKKLLSMLQIAI